MKKVSGCIVTYHNYSQARNAVESFFEKTKGVELTLYIVDNNSGDDTLEKLKHEFPQLITIQNDENKGFGHGHNTAIPFLDSDYHAVINPDITIDRDVLTELCDFMENNPNVGLLSPEIRFPDGSVQPLGKRNPTVFGLVGRHIFKKSLKKYVDHYLMLDENLTIPQELGFATGCFMFFRTDVFREVSGFDERFFIYYEDMDITRRVAQKKRALFYPYTYVYHCWERASSHKPKYFIILVLGMFKYFGKWGWQFK